MKITKVINELSLKGYVYAQNVIPFVILGLIMVCLIPETSFADEAKNRLAGLKDEVRATFGANSDVPYFLLLAEALGGTYAFIKTKNIAVLTGVPVLMLWTHWALK